MSELIRAGLHRYRKSKIFIFGLISTILSGIFSSLLMLIYEYSFAIKEGISIQLITLTIIISICIGSDYSSGGIKNQIISGYTKRNILLSQIIIYNLINIFLLLIFSITACLYTFTHCSIINDLNFLFTSFEFNILHFFDICLASILLTTLFVIISFYAQKNIISFILCFFILFCMVLTTKEITFPLNENEYIKHYIGPIHSYSPRNCSEKDFSYTKNPEYVDGLEREFYLLTSTLLPTTYNFSTVSVMLKNVLPKLELHMLIITIEIFIISRLGLAFTDKKNIS